MREASVFSKLPVILTMPSSSRFPSSKSRFLGNSRIRRREKTGRREAGSRFCSECLEDRVALAGDAFDPGSSGLVYRTWIDPGPDPLEVYDPDTALWIPLGTLSTCTSLAVSERDLYVFNDATNTIRRYDHSTNTWTDVHIGPPVSVEYGNLEITNDSEILVTKSCRAGRDARVLDYTKGTGLRG
jgi:hypothetical protein